MSDGKSTQEDIPILTDVVADDDAGHAEPGEALDRASLIAELQTRLSASAFALTEEVLHAAISEMEASLFEEVSARLRRELPELIDRVLREHIGEDPEES